MEVYNNIQLNEADIEILRIERLVEEREEYENGFFSMEDISKSEEMDYAILNYEFDDEFLSEPLDYEYEFLEPIEDNLDKLRDEKLIAEREEYEIDYFKNFNIETVEKDFLDILIESYEEPEEPEPDFEMDYEYYFEDCCDDYYTINEPEFINAPLCGYDLDYMPNDNIYDYLDCYDYPDSPNENLDGIIYSL